MGKLQGSAVDIPYICRLESIRKSGMSMVLVKCVAHSVDLFNCNQHAVKALTAVVVFLDPHPVMRCIFHTPVATMRGACIKAGTCVQL